MRHCFSSHPPLLSRRQDSPWDSLPTPLETECNRPRNCLFLYIPEQSLIVNFNIGHPVMGRKCSDQEAIRYLVSWGPTNRGGKCPIPRPREAGPFGFGLTSWGSESSRPRPISSRSKVITWGRICGFYDTRPSPSVSIGTVPRLEEPHTKVPSITRTRARTMPSLQNQPNISYLENGTRRSMCRSRCREWFSEPPTPVRGSSFLEDDGSVAT